MGEGAAQTIGSAGAVLALAAGMVALVAAVVVIVVVRRSTRNVLREAQTIREDIDRRIEAERGERMSLETILAALEEGIVLFGTDGAVVYRNRSSVRLLRREVEQVSELAPSELRLFVEDALRGTWRPPLDVTTGPASTLGAVAVALPAGQVMLSLQDVTRARRLDGVRSDFVANASHELKTPVASIQALAETLADASTQDPPSVPRFAQQLTRETERLTRIVSDLLDLSRLEGGPAQTTSIRLDRVAAEEAERFGDRARGEGLHLGVTSSGRLLVEGSERDLRLLVRNLVQNALQYTGPGGRIQVETGAEDGSAVLRVRDTGIGIPSRDRDRIFERFYRVDRARSRDTGGTGLGLAIVRHVAENHGGTVAVDSELGKGSTFTVRLPVAGSRGEPGPADEGAATRPS
jgi:two-component system sensor histidine kinase SenX3